MESCNLAGYGVIVKELVDRLKVRLIHDLSRGGVNQQVKLRERVILPSLSDLAKDLIELAGKGDHLEDLEIFIIDFKDAFKQLRVAPEEQIFVSGQVSAGWFAYTRLLFGIVSGPLLWGRVAALIMRSTVAMFNDDAARAQCYVDDPILVIKGTTTQRKAVLRQVVLWWLALGFPFSWHKAQLGQAVEWIGASIRICPKEKEVAMGVPKEKTDKLLTQVCAALRSPIVPRKDLENMAGLVEWMAGILPQLKPFNQMLWAALGARANNIYSKQIALALEWFKAFPEGRGLSNERIFQLTPPRFTIVVAFDASTTGGGQ